MDSNTFMHIVSDLPEDKIMYAIYQEGGVRYLSSIYQIYVSQKWLQNFVFSFNVSL
jgi:hypothetical protein